MLQSDKMTRVVFIILVAMLVTNCLAGPSCKPNEQLTDCKGECKLRICPKHENYDASCSASDICAPQVCDCRFNYKRGPNGTCIPSEECPKFDCNRPNEEFVACPPLCPTDDCSDATPDGLCSPFFGLGPVIECQPTCRCIKGYWRKNSVCVPYDQCTKVSESPELI